MIFDEAIQSGLAASEEARTRKDVLAGVQDRVPEPHSVKVFQHARFAAFTQPSSRMHQLSLQDR